VVFGLVLADSNGCWWSLIFLYGFLVEFNGDIGGLGWIWVDVGGF